MELKVYADLGGSAPYAAKPLSSGQQGEQSMTGALGVPDGFSGTSHTALSADDVLDDDVRCPHHCTTEAALSLHTTQRSAGQHSRWCYWRMRSGREGLISRW